MKAKPPKTITIDCEDTGLAAEDGPFRSLELSTEGSTVEEMTENAVIFEIDQDGGTFRDMPLANYSQKIQCACGEIIRDAWENRQQAILAYQIWDGGVRESYEAEKERDENER